MLRVSVIIAGMLICLGAPVPGVMAASGPGLWGFKLTQFSVIQSKGQSYAAYGGWSPLLDLGGSLGIRGDLGIGGAKKNSNGGTQDFGLVGIANLAVLASLNLGGNSLIEAGPGYQLWLGAGSAKALTGNVGYVYQFSSPLLWFFDALTVEYSAVLLKNNFTHEAKLGLIL